VCTKGYTRRFKSCKRMNDNKRKKGTWDAIEKISSIWTWQYHHARVQTAIMRRKNHLRYLWSIDDTRWESSTTNKFTEKQTTKDSLINSPKYSIVVRKGYIGWLRSSKTMIDSARKIGTREHNRKTLICLDRTTLSSTNTIS